MNNKINCNKLKDNCDPRKMLLISLLLSIIVPILLAILLHAKLSRYLHLYHTILEMTCIFSALYVFFSVWLNYDKVSSYYRILGFGYLLAAIFDALHTFYFYKLDVSANLYNDLSTKFWILGRFTQAIVLYIYIRRIKLFHQRFGKTLYDSELKISEISIGKYVIILTVLLFAFFISYFTIKTSNRFFILSTSQGLTPIKVILECIIILILLITLLIALFGLIKITQNNQTDVFNYFDNNSDYNYSSHTVSTVSYRCIIILLIISVLSEACFIFYSSISTVTFAIGHVLKIVSYKFLYRSIFIETITYPFNILEREQKKLKGALKETNELAQTLNDILDALPVAIIRYDQNGIMKHVNKKFEELLGYKKEELYGLTEIECQRIAHMTISEQVIFHDAGYKNTNNMDNVIRQYRTKSGEYIQLRVVTHKLTRGLLKVLYDAKKEQELEDINLQTQTILNAVNNIVLVIDKSNKIVLCNKALEELCGIKREKLIGMDMNELYRFIDSDSRELLDSAFNNHTTTKLHEVSFINSNGENKNLLLYITPIHNIDKEVIGTIIAGTDVTELKEQQKILIQQEKLAILGQMGAGIVHETRNFLSTIKGRCQLIDMLTEDQSIKNHISKISDNIDELNMMMSEFLFLSKPRQPYLDEISMYDIIHSIKNMIETSSFVKGVTVNFDLSKEERYLKCDEAQIKQVILNICKNAVDAMAEKDHAKLRISTGYNEQNNEMFVKIADNGKGIHKEDLGKISTPFFTTKPKGTGLGLSICYSIIKEHNGRIEVESELGKGTTFTIILPCISDEDYDENEGYSIEYYDEEEDYDKDKDLNYRPVYDI